MTVEREREMNSSSGYMLVEEFTGPADGLEAGVKVKEGVKDGTQGSSTFAKTGLGPKGGAE